MKKFNLFLLCFVLIGCLSLTSCSNKGEKGDPGKGIANIEKTDTDGLVDTYTITFTDGKSVIFTVTNGKNGAQGATGEKGEQGEQGIQGIQGATGEKGEKGDKGDQGDKGATGEMGNAGKSAYEIFKDYYPSFKGNEKDWINAIITSDKCALTIHTDNDIVDIVKVPTLEEEGKETLTCKDCDEVREVSISKIVVSDAKVEDGYIYYGYYPQTVVTDNDVITELDKITEVDSNGYKTYNNEKYLEYTSTTSYTASNSTTIEAGKHYYKVEPIKWIVMSNENGKLCLFSAYIIDFQIYGTYWLNEYRAKEDYQGHSESVRANNYKYSEIRTWLNTTFLERAFETDSSIYITEVDNSAESTIISGNINACENTFDKVFLMSFQELSQTYSSISKVTAYTDYAKAQGVDENSLSGFVSRSPYYSGGSDGGSHSYVYNEAYGSPYVNNNVGYKFGIRPAMYLATENNNNQE